MSDVQNQQAPNSAPDASAGKAEYLATMTDVLQAQLNEANGKLTVSQTNATLLRRRVEQLQRECDDLRGKLEVAQNQTLTTAAALNSVELAVEAASTDAIPAVVQ